jgi:hypothetical protein
MTHRIRMARKRLMVADERFWAAWHGSYLPPPAIWIAMDNPKVQRVEKALRAIERRKEKLT